MNTSFEHFRYERKKMVFSGLEFILLFMPVFFLLYYLLPASIKNAWILVGSIVFYYWGTNGNIYHLLLLLTLILVDFLLGLLLDRSNKKIARTILYVIGIGIHLSVLFLFKYFDFVVQSIPGTQQIPSLHLILPIGISFFTFQAISYLTDIYRREEHADNNILHVGAYLMFFPKIVAGPITGYSSFRVAFRDRQFKWSDTETGLKKFALGLSYKVLIANQLAHLWKEVGTIGYESISTPLAWMGVIAFSLQIYFDFYGYSLMAVGLAKMMGFDISDNFSTPYMSVSMTEFFRKWHITLGTWFKKYVYFPLGGNRVGKFRTLLNIAVVWLLTGIWHGASYNFIIWGMGICFLILIEKMGLLKILNKCRFLGHIYMVVLIPMSWLVFAISDLGELCSYFARLFPFLGNGGTVVFAGDYIKYGKMYGVYLLLGIILSTGIQNKFLIKYKDKVITTIILLILFWLSVYGISKGINDPFMYSGF